MDRFQAPTANDDYSECNNCWRKFYYTALKDGLCPNCQPVKDDEEREDE
jgi:hypothetical protein